MDVTMQSKPPRTASDEKIIALADFLSVEFESPLIPVKRIAEERGIDVVFKDFAKFSDVAGLCDFSASSMYVNNAETFEEQMFTIAHELGHWELHRSLFDTASSSDSQGYEYEVLMRDHTIKPGDNPLEDEANLFARHLLVPSRLLKSVSHATDETLARMFVVSTKLIAQRRSELGA
jgi:Zn-dependent peptidase ImmA (M78 family)